MAWKIEFYDEKLLKEIRKWPTRLQARFARIINLIEELGPADVGMPHVKTMGKGLFEVRVKSDEGIGRALFCILKGKVIVILTGFIKKTQKTPQQEIEKALKRLKEVKDNE